MISIQEWWEPENGIRPDGAVPEWVHGMVMMMLFCQCILGKMNCILKTIKNYKIKTNQFYYDCIVMSKHKFSGARL